MLLSHSRSPYKPRYVIKSKTSMIKKCKMKKLLWSWIILFNIHVNGMMMEFDEMEWFTVFNGTKVFQTQNDVFSEAKFPMVGLTLIQSAAAKGAGNIFFFILFFGIIYVSCYTIFDFSCSVFGWKSSRIPFASRVWFRSEQLARSIRGLVQLKHSLVV